VERKYRASPDRRVYARGQPRSGCLSLRRGLATLHRVHEKPDAPKKVLEFEEMAKAFGYTLGVEDLHRQKSPSDTAASCACQEREAPHSYGHGRERGMKVSVTGYGELRDHATTLQRLLKKLVGSRKSVLFPI